jgi:polar amino acid transport system substrate-binding protein
MKRVLQGLLIGLAGLITVSRRACAASLLAWAVLAPAAMAETVTLTAETTVPAVMLQNGRVTGHAAEKVHEIMRRARIDYKMDVMPWKRAYTLALTQSATCVFMTTRTREREALFKWIGPISQADWVLYGRADRRYPILSLDDALGYRIGAYNGDVRGEYLAAHGHTVDFVQNDDSNPKKLMLDRIDLWVNSTRSSRAVLARVSLTGKVVPVLTFHQAKLYLACHSSLPEELFNRMDSALRGMEADGTYKAIEQRFEHLQANAGASK